MVDCLEVGEWVGGGYMGGGGETIDVGQGLGFEASCWRLRAQDWS